MILAIETSCDETSVALVENEKVIKEITFSQIEKHKVIGGVIPEYASRLHDDQISHILKKFKDFFPKIKLIAITYGPGLVNALQVGLIAAKTLALALNVPILGIDHIEGHIFSPFINNEINFENKNFLNVIISGGHTEIIYSKKLFEYELIGKTKDDSVGEVYDKVARIYGLEYPGGPIIDKMARKGNYISNLITCPNLENKSMSFSGIKSAMLRLSEKNYDMNDLFATFHKIMIDQIFNKLYEALKEKEVDFITISAGVSANSYLRLRAKELKWKVYFPELKYTGDNATMIGNVAYLKLKYNRNILENNWMDIDANPRLKLY